MLQIREAVIFTKGRMSVREQLTGALAEALLR